MNRVLLCAIYIYTHTFSHTLESSTAPRVSCLRCCIRLQGWQVFAGVFTQQGLQELPNLHKNITAIPMDVTK
jgi:hypothetical protein